MLSCGGLVLKMGGRAAHIALRNVTHTQRLAIFGLVPFSIGALRSAPPFPAPSIAHTPPLPPSQRGARRGRAGEARAR